MSLVSATGRHGYYLVVVCDNGSKQDRHFPDNSDASCGADNTERPLTPYLSQLRSNLITLSGAKRAVLCH